MTGCWHLLELTWHFICFCYNYNVKNYNDNNSSYRSRQTGCWIQPVGGISKDRGGIHGGGELWWSSLLCCSWPRVLSERSVCVSESWREGSMNKADSVNYSEKCFWMPWGKKRAGGEFIYVCVYVWRALKPLAWTEVALESEIYRRDFERAERIDSNLLFKELRLKTSELKAPGKV